MNPADSSLAERAVAAVAAVVSGPASLHEPEFAGNEWTYVKDCIDTGWVSTAGKYVERFETDLAEFTGADHAIATVNGTAALHAALVLAGTKPDDEVIVPALTFVATANAVSYCGALPHFADVEERTLGLDPAKLTAHLDDVTEQRQGECFNRETGRRISAVICMHTFGHPVDLKGIVAVCDRFGLTLIEDAAESLGSYYKDRHTGNHGRVAALSFNGNKTITTGGGGAILTNDPDLAVRAKHLTTTAKLPHRWQYVHDQVAFNYRLPNINAALGCAQLEQLPDMLSRKRRLAEAYQAAFEGVAEMSFITEPENCRSNYWLNAVALDPDCASQMDVLLEHLNAAGFMSRPAWTPLHRLSMFEQTPRMDLSVAEALHGRLINIPSSPRLVERC